MPLPHTFLDDFINNTPIKEHGVVLRRLGPRDNPMSRLSTNVPHLVQKHSPDGYEWGYGGSGPSDLALNIIENVLRLMGHKGAIRFSSAKSDGRIFQDSYDLHQSFKRRFIESVPDEAAEYTMPYETIVLWIEGQFR